MTLNTCRSTLSSALQPIGPGVPYMAEVRVCNLAREIQSYTLETFRLMTRSLAQDGTQLCPDGSWLVTRKSGHLDCLLWDVEILMESRPLQRGS